MLYLFGIVALIMPIFFIERRQRVDDKQTLMLKCMSTFIIVFLSIVNWYTFKGETTYFAMTLTGLTMCLIGDFLLGYCHVLGKGHKLYNTVRGVGMLTFMCAHFFFLINYAVHLTNFVWYLIFIPICVSILMFIASPYAGIKWPKKSLAIISFMYMITICLMLFFGIYYAIELHSSGVPRMHFRMTMVCIACILFFTSDTILCFMYFGGKKGTPISVINLVTYYLSLICLALAF